MDLGLYSCGTPLKKRKIRFKIDVVRCEREIEELKLKTNTNLKTFTADYVVSLILLCLFLASSSERSWFIYRLQSRTLSFLYEIR